MSQLRFFVPHTRHLSRYARPFRREWLPITSILNDMQRVMQAFDEDAFARRDRYIRRQQQQQGQDDAVNQEQQPQQQLQASAVSGADSTTNTVSNSKTQTPNSGRNDNQVSPRRGRSTDDASLQAWDPFDFGFGFPSLFSRAMVPNWARQEMQSFNPRLDVVEEDKLYRVAVELPGVRKEDLKIRLGQDGYGGRTLTIAGERRSVWGDEAENASETPQAQAQASTAEKTDSATDSAASSASSTETTASRSSNDAATQSNRSTGVRGVSYGSFSRTISLPEDVDVQNISAKQDHGILRLVLPKLERPAVEKEHEITVQ